MWQLYELGALFTSASQDVVDKFALVRAQNIDAVIATFHRMLLFLLATIAIGIVGPLGSLQPFSHWELLAFAPLSVSVSLLWTYILRKIEVLTIGAAFYLAPLIYLFVDSHILKTQFTTAEMVGVLLLALGGSVFAIDRKTFRLKSEITVKVTAALVLTVLYNGAEAYLFKHVNAAYGLNGVSFFANLWFLGTLLLLALTVVQCKSHLLTDQTSRRYAPQVAISKSADALSSVLSAQALSLAAVSQVSAFDALFPLISFVVVLIAQGIFRMRINESLEPTHLIWKASGVAMLAIGSLLVT